MGGRCSARPGNTKQGGDREPGMSFFDTGSCEWNVVVKERRLHALASRKMDAGEHAAHGVAGHCDRDLPEVAAGAQIVKSARVVVDEGCQPRVPTTRAHDRCFP